MKIVIKVGTASLQDQNKNDGINHRLILQLTEVISQLKSQNHQVVLVSSGAVGLGCQQLRWTEKPKSVTSKQVAASVGQIMLAQVYKDAFAKHRHIVGQVLLTRLCMENRERYFTARISLRELLDLGAIPIVNENDVVADDEIKFSDNDYLAALTCELIGADRLFVLTDIEGLCTDDPNKNPQAQLIPIIEQITPALEERIQKNRPGNWGTGGMFSKVQAAKMATSFGCMVHILSYKQPFNVLKILSGESYGTTFLASQTLHGQRKGWIAFGMNPTGQININVGALQAIENQKNLLPVGVESILGNFPRGQAVNISHENTVIAKGISKYSSEDLQQIIGCNSEKIEEVLGYSYGHSVVHRDDLVLIN